jgi:hypothetical protein
LNNPKPSMGGLPGDAIVFRRIPYWQYDHDRQTIYASAFKNDDGICDLDDRHSVNWKAHTTIEKTMEGHRDRFGLAEITVQAYVDECQIVQHSPRTDDCSHCDAIGEKLSGVKNRLRKKARILIQPPLPPT